MRMKNLFLLTTLIFFSTSVFSQNFLGMKVKKYGIVASYDKDRVQDLDAEYFMRLSKYPIERDLREVDFNSRDIISMVCENPALRAEVTVLPFTKFQNLQLNLGSSLMFNRIDATNYIFNNFGETKSHFGFKSRSHEAAVDASMVLNKKISFVNFYGGLGANLGMTFAGNMSLSGRVITRTEIPGEAIDDVTFFEEETSSFYEQHELENIFHQRAFLQGGLSFMILKRLELGFEGRAGLGLRSNSGNETKTTKMTSFGLVARWNLK